MARTGMVRLGPLALILTLVGFPARGALMPFEPSRTITEAPAGSPLPGSRFSEGFIADRFGTPRLHDHSVVEAGVEFRLTDGLIARPETFDPRSMTAIDPEGTSSPAYLPQNAPGAPPPSYLLGLAAHPSPLFIPADGMPPAEERHGSPIDASSAAPSPDPPLALAFLLGVSAWASHHAWAKRRPERFAPARRVPSPPFAPGTTIVLANRPRPAERRSTAGPRMIETAAPARPLILAATFVEVSTRTGPPALPAWRPDSGATAVSVRRSRAVRRVPA